jgi:hypothetical protein
MWMDMLYIPITPSLRQDWVFYPNGMISPAVMDITYNPNILNENSYTQMGLDFSDKYIGYKFYTEKTPNPVTLDGTMSPDEKALNLKNQNWFVVYRELGYGFLMMLEWDRRLKNATTDIVYIDDEKVIMKPESEPGQHLCAFYSPVTQFIKGKWIFNIYIYMGFEWTKGMEKRYLDIISNPLKAQTRKIL